MSKNKKKCIIFSVTEAQYEILRAAAKQQGVHLVVLFRRAMQKELQLTGCSREQLDQFSERDIKWTKEKVEILKQNWETHTMKGLAELLDLAPKAIRRKGRKLGLRRRAQRS